MCWQVLEVVIGNCLVDLFGQDYGLFQCYVGQQDGEFFVVDVFDDVIVCQCGVQVCDQFVDYCVIGWMVEFIVDVFEEIDVQYDQGYWRLLQDLVCLFEYSVVIECICEIVMVCFVIELIVQLFQVCIEQVQFVFGVVVV